MHTCIVDATKTTCLASWVRFAVPRGESFAAEHWCILCSKPKRGCHFAYEKARLARVLQPVEVESSCCAMVKHSGLICEAFGLLCNDKSARPPTGAVTLFVAPYLARGKADHFAVPPGPSQKPPDECPSFSVPLQAKKVTLKKVTPKKMCETRKEQSSKS